MKPLKIGTYLNVVKINKFPKKGNKKKRVIKGIYDVVTPPSVINMLEKYFQNDVIYKYIPNNIGFINWRRFHLCNK